MSEHPAIVPLSSEDIHNRFDHHAPDEERIKRHALIRSALREMAQIIVDNTPQGREQSTAVTKLEEAMFWANAGIARETLD